VSGRKYSPRALLSQERRAYLADALRTARQACALTQEGLAEVSGVTTEQIQRIEGARTNPTLGTLYALTDALDVAVADLLPE
jgi:transcriptional regulator with XRE-family HTH domain